MVYGLSTQIVSSHTQALKAKNEINRLKLVQRLQIILNNKCRCTQIFSHYKTDIETRRETNFQKLLDKDGNVFLNYDLTSSDFIKKYSLRENGNNEFVVKCTEPTTDNYICTVKLYYQNYIGNDISYKVIGQYELTKGRNPCDLTDTSTRLRCGVQVALALPPTPPPPTPPPPTPPPKNGGCVNGIDLSYKGPGMRCNCLSGSTRVGDICVLDSILNP